MVTCDLGFGGSREDGVADGADLIALEAAGSTLVGAALLCGGDALGLALADEFALELGEGAHHVELERCHRVRVSGFEGESFLEELDARALPGPQLRVFGGVAGDLLDDVVEVDD